MPKVAIIGAGSIVFCQTLMLDILGTPGLEGTEFALMAPSTSRTAQVEGFAQRVIKDNRLPAKVWKTTDRREALDGADYVIATFQVGGVGTNPRPKAAITASIQPKALAAPMVISGME